MATDTRREDGLIFLLGATGVGKSAVAMELARTQGAAILAMDAMQVYRGADIGTSKALAVERAEVMHGGLDLVEFGERFDVAQYLRHAGKFLEEQREGRRRVIIVGGTGLYFRALTQGLCEAPPGEDELRAELNGFSVEELRGRLRKVDPRMLERLDGANPRRLIRAIEVMEATGRSLRSWQEEAPEPLVKKFQAFWIERSKEELNERIAARMEAMFAQGWVKEVRGLVARHGLGKVRGFPGIGYGEIGERIASCALPAPGQPGAQATEQVKGDILVATRQYAKRQLTWFRREPKLRKVMLSGTRPFPAEVLSLS